MPRRARIHYSSLRSCLVNLPLSLYGGLVQGNVVGLNNTFHYLLSIVECVQRPQRLGVHLKPVQSHSDSLKDGILLGWTGLASSSSLSNFSRSANSSSLPNETVELDPQLALVLGAGFREGDVVGVQLASFYLFSNSEPPR